MHITGPAVTSRHCLKSSTISKMGRTGPRSPKAVIPDEFLVNLNGVLLNTHHPSRQVYKISVIPSLVLASFHPSVSPPRDVPALIKMRYIPASFSKILSSVSSKNVDTLPSHSSQTTLFDDLPPAEKAAALRKLSDLAAQQPGQSPKSKTRRFSWKIFAMVFGVLSLLVLAIVATVYAVDQPANADLVQQLRMANTNLDRMALLPNDDDWLFDFTQSEKYTFAPGGGKPSRLPIFPS